MKKPSDNLTVEFRNGSTIKFKAEETDPLQAIESIREMPEGWKRFERRIKASGLTLENAGDRYAVTLLAEMAEAVEEINTKGLYYICGPSDKTQTGYTFPFDPKFREVLKKWKEWK